MRSPRRHRPQRRRCAGAPEGVDLAVVAHGASYVGSCEHKTVPWFAGSPKPRADASKCDPQLADADALTGWLQDAIRAGRVSELWEGDFPRYAWHRHEEVVYEARLTNSGLGQYKGYPLEAGEEPEGLT